MDTAYILSLTTQQKANILRMLKRMNDKGITNLHTQAGIMAVVSKESSFIPKSEMSYKNTLATQIKKIFGSRLVGLTDAQIDVLKKDDKKFFDKVYGGLYGNSETEGYLYRGRGLNQLTFKGNYEKYGNFIGVDLVKNPDKANDIDTATDILIAFFKNGIASNPKTVKQYYNADDINDFGNNKDAVGAIYHANAGFGHSYADLIKDPTGGRAKALSRVDGFYDLAKDLKDSGYDFSKLDSKKKSAYLKYGLITVGVAIVITSSFLAYKYYFNKG